MKSCCLEDEPECSGSECREWGFCEFSLQSMWEDSSVREEWIQELKKQGKKLPEGATATWRRFLRQKRQVPVHAPCPKRRREVRDGVDMDWCYAIGLEEVGDMPCEYCKDREPPSEKA